MEAARTLKANLKLDGKPCGWCEAALRLGDDAAVCNSCEKEHHSACWESKGGCATASCLSAPLRRLDAPAVGASSARPPYTPASAFGFPPRAGVPASPTTSGLPLGPPPAGFMHCPICHSAIIAGTPLCPNCRSITSPDGIYHGPKTNAPGSVASLVVGIIGMFFCGIILGPIAIAQSNSAKRAIAGDPTLGGRGLATAGMVLGIIALVFNVIGFMVMLGGRR